MIEINLKLSTKSAKELADLKIELGLAKPEDREKEIKNYMKPEKVLFKLG